MESRCRCPNILRRRSFNTLASTRADKVVLNQANNSLEDEEAYQRAQDEREQTEVLWEDGPVDKELGAQGQDYREGGAYQRPQRL